MGLQTEIVFGQRISYVMYQNRMDVILGATATNEGDAVENIGFRLTSEPAFFRDVVCGADRIGPFDSIDLRSNPSFKVELDPTVIESLTERMVSTVRLTATDADGNVISESSCDVTVLPFNDWPGCDMPETIASFVTPNASSLAGIRASMSDILASWGKSPSLEGYQSDRDRVLEMAAAAYAALEKANITYVNPPAGFESSGQRVRLPDEVLGNHEGTCIDLAVLYASVLESIGLNTMVHIVRGHAFAGLWLVDDYHPEMVMYDSSATTRRIRNGEMRAVECTTFTNGSRMGFEDACRSALSKLEDADSFICTVDIRRTRTMITPLPVRKLVDGEWVVEREERESITYAPSPADEIYADMESRQLTRVDRWKRDLLDITNRNNMINMKQGTKVVPLLTSDISSFEDGLARGEEFTLLPRPQEWDSAKAYGERPFESENYIGNYASSASDELSRRRIRTPMTELETERGLKSVYRLATKEIEESGCNSLFIALGILRWYEGRSTGTARYAPLILLPAEMRRRQNGYSVKKLDEETVFNVTLQEKLRQEFDIVLNVEDPLPTDDDGVNVRRILQSVRRAIDGKEGWEVLEGAALGVFSFNQFVMWKDLDGNIDRLRENPVVDCLIEGRPYPADKELTEDSDPYGLCLTVPADGSQIKAVKASGNGRTFVMHGPPGTGKSQTITNMITNALFQGKTVLFVAEKRAALEVVQKRLEDVGIGNHCLELHSNKSEKGAVLEQLRKAVTPDRECDEGKRDELMTRIEGIRNKLDAYVSDLHRAMPWGLSAYDCISRYEENDSEECVDIDFSTSRIMEMRPEDETAAEDGVRLACQAYRMVRDIDCPELREIGMDSVMASVKDDLKTVLNETSEKAENAISCRNALKQCNLPVDIDDSPGMKRLFDTVCSITPGMAKDPYLNEVPRLSHDIRDRMDRILSSVNGWVEMGLRIHESNVSDVMNLIAEVRPMISTAQSRNYIDGSGITRLLDDINRFCSTYIRLKPDMDTVSGGWRDSVYQLDGEWRVADNWSSANSAGFFGKGKARKAFLDRAGAHMRDPGVKFESLSSTVNIISSISSDVRWLQSFLSAFRSRTGDVTQDREGLESLSKQATSAISAAASVNIPLHDLPSMYDRIVSARPKADDYLASMEQWRTASQKARDFMKTSTDISTPESFIAMRDRLMPHIDGIYDWANWNHYSGLLPSLGVPDAKQAIMSGIDEEVMIRSVNRSMYRTMIELCRQESETLRMFNASTFENLIEQFRKLDLTYTNYSRNLLKHRLSRNIPRNMDSSVPGTETNTLYKAINSARLRKSIRTLLKEIPNILPRICPCLLMSPQSVSQYITMDFPKFDLVIFDESSQITTCKAIGALGRAKNAVIAGDRRQLPPTSFFQKKIESEDDDEMVDIDSFLDDCLSLNMPETYLEWHYRSRHESLIAFSNRTFYENRMLTFPSPNDQETRVGIRWTGGTYERGKRDNPVEAKAVVEEIRRRVMDDDLCKQSIGVVAFSISQQNCIEDMFDEMKSKDDKLYQRVNDMPEPIFIKNLETVQGDEKDVIMFSIGYGPTADGTVPQNFGPINRDGGGRRLNVAVSRARSEMVVFTSMRSTDIKVTPMSKSGVVNLKDFLMFAENGGHFPGRTQNIPSEGDSSIIGDIASALSEHGYQSHFGVGSSEFKVDVAVVDPDDPDEYLLGILTDGQSYRASSNTRDREYARADVLRRLGWNLTHVWSMDWRFNRDKIVSSLLEKLDAVRQGRVIEQETTEEVEEDVGIIETHPEEQVLAGLPKTEPVGRCRPYIPIDIVTTPMPLDSMSGDMMRAIASDIILRESPVNETLLLKLFCKRVDIKRLSEKNRTMLLGQIGRLPHEERDGFVTYWSPDMDPSSYDTYRVGDRETNRDITQVPLAEIVNAIVDTVGQSGSLTEESISPAVARALGYSRSGTNVRAIIGDAVDMAVRDGRIRCEDGRYLPAQQ